MISDFPNKATSEKITFLLSVLPSDLAQLIIFSSLSLNDKHVNETITCALEINLQRVIDDEEQNLNPQKIAENIISSAMESFQKNLADSKEKNK